jgi:hypothetical protein
MGGDAEIRELRRKWEYVVGCGCSLVGKTQGRAPLSLHFGA